MRGIWIAKIVLFALLAATALSFVVMSLWNWLMPALFGLRAMSFWQALGLLVLSRILLGGLRRRGPQWGWRRRMLERWEQMTPEDREKFREGMRARCSSFRPRTAEPKA